MQANVYFVDKGLIYLFIIADRVLIYMLFVDTAIGVVCCAYQATIICCFFMCYSNLGIFCVHAGRSQRPF